MLSRRGFLGRLVGALAAVVAAPALLEASDPIVPVEWGPVEAVSYGTPFEVGDVITIRGRYAVHPATGRELAHLQRFVVTQKADAVEIAAWPMILSPRLIGPGSPYQNVSSAAPFSHRDVQAWAIGPAPVGLTFHRDAFALTMRGVP